MECLFRTVVASKIILLNWHKILTIPIIILFVHCLIYANNANYVIVSINGTQSEIGGTHVVWRWGKQEKKDHTC
jgi:hypothetical protein